MRVRNEIPVLALIFCVPAALFAINYGPANLDADQADQTVSAKAAVDMSNDLATDANKVYAADDEDPDTDTSLNMNDEGSTDSWHRRGWRGRGWGGRGWWGGWGGYGYSWPYYGYSYAYPYYNNWWY